MDGPILITFGVELEFYIRFKQSDYEEAIKAFIANSEKWGWVSYQGLVELAVQSHMITALKEHQIAVNDIEAREENYTKWTVARDSTIQPGTDNLEYVNPEFSFEGIELKSPALPYSSRSVEHISQVISIINETFKTSVNRSTGFHIHVGNEAAGFPLQTLKNFASLVTIFQPQIHSIHAKERLDNPFCAPPSTIFRQEPPLEIAKTIYSISNLGDFLHIFTADENRFQAYNFQNLRERLKTIEFRQHKGTMEVDEIWNYIHLVCGLICTSHLAGPAGFTDLIIRYATKPDSEHYSFLNLLADLELDRLIPYYSTRLRSHRRLSHEWHAGLESPKISAHDKEDDEEPQDTQRPAWEGPPEFETRPARPVIDPHNAPHQPEQHGPLENKEDTALDGESHDEARVLQPPAQTGWDSRESEAPPGQSWVSDSHDNPDIETQDDTQGLEDEPQQMEENPRQLRIANPDDDSDSKREEDLGPIEEPAEWSDFGWDCRDEASEDQHPTSAGFDSQWESESRQPGHDSEEREDLNPLPDTQDGPGRTEREQGRV